MTAARSASAERIAVIGTGGHARVVADAVQLSPNAVLAGYLDERLPAGTRVGAAAVFGTLDALSELLASATITAVVVAIGDNSVRERVVEQVNSRWTEARFGIVIHPSAVVAGDVMIGAGSVVLAGAVANVGTRIAEHCILNTGCSLDHDSELGAFGSIAPGAVLGGGVRIGTRTAVGIGVTVSNDVSIGRDTVVGAGAVVVRDLPDAVVAYGVPAREVRSRRPGEPYMGSGGGQPRVEPPPTANDFG